LFPLLQLGHNHLDHLLLINQRSLLARMRL
jgi:hypothetical protein